MSATSETATFAAGCFWGIESAYRKVPGVTATAVGYMGGTVDNPTYHDVCSDTTGHAEVVQVTFDPDRVSYDDLLTLFWQIHDPTTLNRQGPDIGSQYRSTIFTHTEDQATSAAASKRRLSEAHPMMNIVTQLVPAGPFWVAEDYHQQYFEKRGMAPTCHLG